MDTGTKLFRITDRTLPNTSFIWEAILTAPGVVENRFGGGESSAGQADFLVINKSSNPQNFKLQNTSVNPSLFTIEHPKGGAGTITKMTTSVDFFSLEFGASVNCVTMLEFGGILAFAPGADDAIELGITTARWSKIWGVDQDLSGSITIASSFNITGIGVTTGNTSKGSTADLIWHGDTIDNIFEIDVSADAVSSKRFTMLPTAAGAGNTGESRFAELVANGSNYVGFQAADSIASNVIWELPAADGAAGEALVTDGNKVLSFAAAGGKAKFMLLAGGENVGANSTKGLSYGHNNADRDFGVLVAGTVIGLSVGMNQVRSGGTCTIRYLINGVADATNTVVIDATETQDHHELFTGDSFVAGPVFLLNL